MPMAHQTLHIQLFGRIPHQPLQYICLKIYGSPNVTYTKVCGHMANQTLQKHVFRMLHMFSMFSMFCMFCLGCRFSMFSSFAGFPTFTGLQRFLCFICFPGLHVLNVFNVFHVFRAGARAGALGLKVSPCRCHFLGLPNS